MNKVESRSGKDEEEKRSAGEREVKKEQKVKCQLWGIFRLCFTRYIPDILWPIKADDNKHSDNKQSAITLLRVDSRFEGPREYEKMYKNPMAMSNRDRNIQNIHLLYTAHREERKWESRPKENYTLANQQSCGFALPHLSNGLFDLFFQVHLHDQFRGNNGADSRSKISKGQDWMCFSHGSGKEILLQKYTWACKRKRMMRGTVERKGWK